ncbi:hypothetical protein Gbro_1442 [Gordonia bronchialis DSM 43247]|uniref:Uncharacterized protein n=1 Tax=Gordonia bronchialis (strain ATCC 25592 / DSM 43247 / BCRC 13721 / JCM 3198 / KCTC 3076 / NBRC 16047 / NCTC 10667) TaxID=526226 RepID=D0L6G7_GORB4|nr:hypothetical protein [Gordonia bronchialis]ACY20724.1 hypothetical protein Gbro_1442 [Gordonia bronchialis DSM 43247]MCC3323497.1 hypothetical protein [Gordonia bronchialis]QGS25526.1 hypothetical protein FOB84_16665 [Gordonia bronchialis]STQ63553.1 Uncharacterised protein [Gordonia bronchialis]
MTTRPVSDLHRAIDSFGRKARQLSVARLLEFDGIIVSLRPELRAGSPVDRRAFAEMVETEIRTCVERFDPIDKRIADAVLAISPEFHDKTVTERRQYVDEHDVGFTGDQFKTRRRRIVGDITAHLECHFGTGALSVADRLDAAGRNHARQVFWRLQDMEVRLESLDLAARAIGHLPAESEYRHHAEKYLQQRTVHTDAVLWGLAHAQRHLRKLQRDSRGRDVLMTLGVEWWDTNIRIPFVDYEIAELVGILSDDDEASAAVSAWIESTQRGRFAHARWLAMLGTTTKRGGVDDENKYDPIRERARLIGNIRALLALVADASSSDVMPKNIRSALADRVLWDTLLFGPTEQGATFNDCTGSQVFRAVRAAMSDRH